MNTLLKTSFKLLNIFLHHFSAAGTADLLESQTSECLALQQEDDCKRKKQEDHSKISALLFMSVHFRAFGSNMVILDVVSRPVEETLSSRATISSLWVSAVGALLKWANPTGTVTYLKASAML